MEAYGRLTLSKPVLDFISMFSIIIEEFSRIRRRFEIKFNIGLEKVSRRHSSVIMKNVNVIPVFEIREVD